MALIMKQLVEVAKAVEPADGFGDYFDLVDALESNPAALARFKAILAPVKAHELDLEDEWDPDYGWFVMHAADAMDLLPDDPRLFLSEADAALIPDEAVLQALCSACIVNDERTVAQLAKRVDVNTLDHNKQFALCYAVGNNHAGCVQILLEHGADPNRVENWGNTAMHIAAQCQSSHQIFSMLINAGGDVDKKNDSGETVPQILMKYDRSDWLNPL